MLGPQRSSSSSHVRAHASGFWPIRLTRPVWCKPLAVERHPTLYGHCLAQITLFTAMYCVDVITNGKLCHRQMLWVKLTDIDNIGIILLLPVYYVSRLQMRTSQKIGVIVTFLLGGFTTIIGIIQLYYHTHAAPGQGKPHFGDATSECSRHLITLLLLTC